MKVKVFQSAAALAFIAAFVTVGTAQTPQQQPPPPAQPPSVQTPTTPPPPAQAPSTQTPTQQRGTAGDLLSMNGQTVTVSGCLMREADVPGQKPNPAERAGIMPDYVLTNVQMRSASPAGTAGRTETPRETAGATTSDTKLKLQKLDGDKAKDNLNKRVEVTGRLDVDKTDAPRGTQLPKLEVASLRVLAQSCTAQ